MEHLHIERLRSTAPLTKLRHSLLLNLAYALVISAALVTAMLLFDDWYIRGGAGLFVLFAIWSIAETVRLYLRVDGQLPFTRALLPEMQRQHGLFSQWVQTQQRAGLLLYPISAAIGFMMGGVVGSNQPVDVFMSQAHVQWLLLASVLVLTPLCHYLTKWMLKVSFGKYLLQLENQIAALESEG